MELTIQSSTLAETIREGLERKQYGEHPVLLPVLCEAVEDAVIECYNWTKRTNLGFIDNYGRLFKPICFTFGNGGGGYITEENVYDMLTSAFTTIKVKVLRHRHADYLTYDKVQLEK